MADFIMTMDDDDAGNNHSGGSGDSDSEGENETLNFKIDPSGFDSKPVLPWDMSSARKKLIQKSANRGTSIDTKIAKHLEASKKGKNAVSESSDDELQEAAISSGEEDDDVKESEESDDDEVDGDEDSGDMDVDADDTIRAIQKKETRKEKRLKAQKKEDLISPFMNSVTFEALQLSRPILKALSELGFNNPTPIQMQTIPAALKGQDICGSAVTGSGKTAAFVLPILERLLYRDTRVPVTRVLILMPTRELAVQCHSVIEKMSKYLGGLTAALVTGGMQVKLQEAELAHRPDIIVATPGRVVDHLLNTKSFGLEDIEILVIDEADRLLELGFNDQLEQIVKMCPRNRQTMLFSATMTGKVEELIDMSLRQATKVSVDPMGSVAKNLTQEFIRVRNSQLEHMEGILVALCKRTFKSKTLIFCLHKHSAHRLKIIFGMFGLTAAELHGNLTQEQRLDALELFRDAKVDFLIASDIASRGLDIIGIETVINFNMPRHISNYIHRVGRTARAGKAGRAVSLVCDGDRKLFKEVVKNAGNNIKQRVVAPEAIEKCQHKIESMLEHIENILVEEQEEKQLRMAEMEAQKLENRLKYQDEILSRPKRTWFISETDKEKQRDDSKQIEYKKGGIGPYSGDRDEEEGGRKKRKRDDMSSKSPKGMKLKPKLSNSKKKRKVTEEDKKMFGTQKAASNAMKKAPHSAKIANKQKSKKGGELGLKTQKKAKKGSIFSSEMKSARVNVKGGRGGKGGKGGKR